MRTGPRLMGWCVSSMRVDSLMALRACSVERSEALPVAGSGRNGGLLATSADVQRKSTWAGLWQEGLLWLLRLDWVHNSRDTHSWKHLPGDYFLTQPDVPMTDYLLPLPVSC
jgi:hypothetical protein